MGEYQLSRKADEDLDGIYEYSIRQFGQKVADEYFLSLTDCLIKLAENPRLGRDCSDILVKCFRFECGRHVIFYKIKRKDIFIIRVLHQSMYPQGFLRK